jgi:hypothetical protein
VDDAVHQSFDGATRDSNSPAQVNDRQRELLATNRSVARRPIDTEEFRRFFNAQQGFGEQGSSRSGASHRRFLSKMGFIVRAGVTRDVTLVTSMVKIPLIREDANRG